MIQAGIVLELDSLTIKALFIPGQGIDTRQANPAGRLQMHILMAVADFERALISERTLVRKRSDGMGKRSVIGLHFLRSVFDIAEIDGSRDG